LANVRTEQVFVDISSEFREDTFEII